MRAYFRKNPSGQYTYAYHDKEQGPLNQSHAQIVVEHEFRQEGHPRFTDEIRRFGFDFFIKRRNIRHGRRTEPPRTVRLTSQNDSVVVFIRHEVALVPVVLFRNAV